MPAKERHRRHDQTAAARRLQEHLRARIRLEGHDLWHVDYGDGLTEDYASEEEAELAADAVARAEERTVVVEE